MSTFVKSKLKGARDALGKKDYQIARTAALQVLDYEPDNYNATVFLALALLELGEIEQSEEAYRKVIKSNPDQLLAWQGISKLYERTQNWDKYADALQHLMDHYAQVNDATKCAESLQKMLELRREKGSRQQLVEVLYLLLPESSLFPTLSNLPPPDPTNPTSSTISGIQEPIHDSLPVLQQIVALVEKDEDETIKREIDKRRVRLNAPSPEDAKREVEMLILGPSRLPHLYNEILNHPNTPDDLRRQTESKLLRHKQRYLHALPSSSEFASVKSNVATELENLINGAVILGIPDELAWVLFIDGKDCETIEGYDYASLRQFMLLFPSLPLTTLINGYFAFMHILDQEGDNDDDDRQGDTNDDPFDTILDAFSNLSGSIIANRIIADVYLQEFDYQNAAKVSENGLGLVRQFETRNGKKLPLVQKAFNVILSTSLVHLYPPKHHPRALRIVDDVLGQDGDNIASLMNRGYILQASTRWTEAGAMFARVSKLIPDDVNDGLRAKEECAWCQIQDHYLEGGAVSLKNVLENLNGLEHRDFDQARCLWRLGKCHLEMGDDEHEEAFRFFITSLKRNPAYAPSFTSLGIYYADYASPPDPTRASKCFQKAFELDPREAEAARRLAESFAEEREWDLVEVVARRTIEGEGGLDAGLKGDETAAAGRYLPTNAWAWKAVGIVELTRKNYSEAIQALQIALRADPDDPVSWLRLGEAYSKGGRHAAAMKSLIRARELQPDDWICSYFIGGVQRQLGQCQEAIDTFQAILASRPSEIGVLMSLGQTYLDLGLNEAATGFTTRAENSFVACIRVATQAIDASPGFRGVAWKTAADAIFYLSNQPSFSDEDDIHLVLSRVASLISTPSERLQGIARMPLLQDTTCLDSLKVLEVAVAAYDYRISLSSSEKSPSGSAWFDLGVAFRSWSRRIPSGEGTQKAEKEAIGCFTEALRQDPGNTMYWNALGTINFSTQPKTAQHAYIRALEIDSKDVATWTNLGLLYLHHGDVELANEAFRRAQTLDPDYALAWFGQGLIAVAHHQDLEAKTLFEHAVGLPTDVPEADLEFASRVFSGLNNDRGRTQSIDALFPAFFLLDRYCKRRPNDVSALHLSGLVCERIGQLELGFERISSAISILEANYEETEDPVIERQFTIATSNLARLKLSLRDYDGACESFESVLGLLSEEEDDPTTRILRAQAQFGSGLANFKSGNLEGAMERFEAALEAAGDNLAIKGQVTVLLAQTLWAIGTEEFRENAKEQLLRCIATDPENLAAITALAGMGILTEDENLVDAALAEILSLPLERRHKLDPGRDVNHLLIHHHLGRGDMAKALSVAQSAVHTDPAKPEIRREVAALFIQKGEYRSALAVLSQAEQDLNDSSESLCLHAIAGSFAGSPADLTTPLRQAQRAIMLSPWQSRNWRTLALVKTHNAQT